MTTPLGPDDLLKLTGGIPARHADAPAGARFRGVAGFDTAGPEDIAMITTSAARRGVKPEHTAAGAVIVPLAPDGGQPEPARGKHVVAVKNPKLVFGRLVSYFHPQERAENKPGVHPTAQIGTGCEIAKSARLDANTVIGQGSIIGPNVWIHPSVTLGAGVTVGEGTAIYPNVSVYAGSVIGRECIIHSGAVIGATGFGYERTDAGYELIPHIGRTVLGDRVEIGAGSAIDRGMIGDTVIGNGVKIDNLVQIGHNCTIGENTVIAGCTGIAGSVKIGKNCVIGGMSGFADHIEICDGAIFAGGSQVEGSVLKPGVYRGSVAFTEWKRNEVVFRSLAKNRKRDK